SIGTLANPLSGRSQLTPRRPPRARPRIEPGSRTSAMRVALSRLSVEGCESYRPPQHLSAEFGRIVSVGDRLSFSTVRSTIVEQASGAAGLAERPAAAAGKTGGSTAAAAT